MFTFFRSFVKKLLNTCDGLGFMSYRYCDYFIDLYGKLSG